MRSYESMCYLFSPQIAQTERGREIERERQRRTHIHTHIRMENISFTVQERNISFLGDAWDQPS